MSYGFGYGNGKLLGVESAGTTVGVVCCRSVRADGEADSTPVEALESPDMAGVYEQKDISASQAERSKFQTRPDAS